MPSLSWFPYHLCRPGRVLWMYLFFFVRLSDCVYSGDSLLAFIYALHVQAYAALEAL